MAEQVIWRGDEVVKKVRQQTEKVLDKLAKKIRDDIERSMREPKTGKPVGVRRKRKG